MKRAFGAAIGAVLLSGAVLLASRQAAPPSSEAAVRRIAFLLGDWSSSADTELGHADAVASFVAGVDGHVVVRRNRVRYTSGKAAGTEHEDLLIVYAEGGRPAADTLQAIYFDNEDHVIRYAVSVPMRGTAVFESDPSAPGPRYRLTHVVSGDELRTTFEIAPPGQAFKTYVSGSATRKRD